MSGPAAVLGTSLELPIAVGVLSQVGHPDDTDRNSESNNDEAGYDQIEQASSPRPGDPTLDVPLLVTPTHSNNGDTGVYTSGIIVDEGRLSITRVEDVATLERASFEPTTDKIEGDPNTRASHQGVDLSDIDARIWSQQQIEQRQSHAPDHHTLDNMPSTTGRVLHQSHGRCGCVLVPSCGSSGSCGQLLLGAGVLVLSVALGGCALYFRRSVGEATHMNSGLVFGSVGSIAMCSIIIGAYISIKWYRRHIHTLLLNLALCEFFLALSFILEPAWNSLGAGAGDGMSCRWLSTVREYLIMCSSGWSTCTALDLYYLMTNPFTSPRLNRQKYQFIAHGAAIASAIIMAVSDSFAAPVAVGDFCWVGARSVSTTFDSTMGSQSASDPRPPEQSKAGIWLFVVAPAVITLGVNSYVSFISFARFRGGIAATLRTRQALLREGFLTTVTLALYSAVLWGVYGGYWLVSSSAVDGGDGTKLELLAHVFSFLLSYRGSVPFVLWCLYRRPAIGSTKGEGTKHRTDSRFKLWSSRDKRPSAAVIDATSAASATATSTDRGSEIDEGDDDAVRPQMNRALLEELVYYTTQGIAVAVRAASEDSVGAYDTLRTFKLTSNGLDGLPAPTSTETTSAFSSDIACKFTDFRPAVFRQIRQVFRIKDEEFLQSLAACSTPKVSEGASGAFMFYSSDRSFIVKSLSSHESNFLNSFLDKYLAHISSHRDTFLTRFLGSYCLVMYGRKAHFVVMENVFDIQHGISIHQRYDIKGSWIDRNAQKPRRGAEATCRHCNLTYRYGVGRNVCPNRAGTSHEPNVVLKDMDLTTKLRFGKTQGRMLLHQLKRDSDFLCEQGIMDYSLLLGVIEVSYKVSQHNILTRDGSVFLQNILDAAKDEQERELADDNGEADIGPRVKQSTRGLRASEVVIGPGFYYIGIIDILQTWSMSKRVERFVKTTLLRNDPDGISAMPPRAYRDRFHRKLHEIIHLGHNSIALPSSSIMDGEQSQQQAGGSSSDAATGENGETSASPANLERESGGEDMEVDRSTAIRPFGVPALWSPQSH